MARSKDAPSGTLLESEARIASAYSEQMINDGGYRGLLLSFKETAHAASPTVTPTIQYRDPATGSWVTYKELTAITGEGTFDALIYPMGLAGASWNVSAPTDVVAGPIPYIWRLLMSAADADSCTYSAGYQYIS